MTCKLVKRVESAGVALYGASDYRGRCQREDPDAHVTCLRMLRAAAPWAARLAVHVENEGKVAGAQHSGWGRRRAKGFAKGVPDIIVPVPPLPLVCELKRRDPTLSKITDEQLLYLTDARDAGSFACVALGSEGFEIALRAWLDATEEAGAMAATA